MAQLFKLIFLDEKVALHFDEEINIDLINYTIQARRDMVLHGNDLYVSFPNPHHYYHNCWGNYMTNLSKLIRDFNLETLFYQVKAAVGSLNFTDYIVINEFLELFSQIANGYYTPHCFSIIDEGCTTMYTAKEICDKFNITLEDDD